MLDLRFCQISFKKTLNRTDPSTDPCGIPDVVKFHSTGNYGIVILVAYKQDIIIEV